MQTTLNLIRAHSPCFSGWRTLLAYLGKAEADDEPLHLRTVLTSNGIADALWCLRAITDYERHEPTIRLYAVWCARQVQHLMTDPHNVAALDVTERYVRGEATVAELEAVRKAAYVAADADAYDVAAYVAYDVAADADAMRKAQALELSRVLDALDTGIKPYP